MSMGFDSSSAILDFARPSHEKGFVLVELYPEIQEVLLLGRSRYSQLVDVKSMRTTDYTFLASATKREKRHSFTRWQARTSLSITTVTAGVSESISIDNRVGRYSMYE